MVSRNFAFLQLMFLVVGFASCGGGNNKEVLSQSCDTSFYFSGDYVYFADAAILNDCATGITIPVSTKNMYIDTERQYLSMNPSQAEPISIEFKGHIIREAPMEAEGLQYAVVIDSMIGFDRTVGCNPEALIPGLYEAQMDNNKLNISLNGDYTFIQRSFKVDQEVENKIYTGEWARLAPDKIMLIYKDVNGKNIDKQAVLLFDFESKILTEMIDSQQVIYKRIYL